MPSATGHVGAKYLPDLSDSLGLTWTLAPSRRALLWETALRSTMENPSSFVQERMHDILSSFIPPPVFSVLAGFSNLVYHLLGTANDPSSWSSTLLPPLATLIAGYVALLIAYRTIQNTIRLVWWGIKWGAIIGAVIAIWAWWTGQADAINSTGSDTASDIGGLLHQAGKCE